MHLAPIIIATYSRVEHFIRCIESLRKNSLASESKIIIGIDFPINENDIRNNEKIKKYCRNIIGFKEVVVKEWSTNHGPERNFKALLDLAFNMSDKVILTEDDNEFHPDFLRYINQGLNQYKRVGEIFAICGYNYPVVYPNVRPESVLSLKAYSAWGVGFWRDKYHAVKKENKAYSHLINTPSVINKINNELGDHVLQHYLHSILNHRNYEDTLISLHMYENKQYCIFPSVSLVKNFGNDGSGTNCIYDEKLMKQEVLKSNLKVSDSMIQIEELSENRRVLNEYFKASLKNKCRFFFNIIKYKFTKNES